MATFPYTNTVDKSGTASDNEHTTSKYGLSPATLETPNLYTFLSVLNTSNPIVKSQWELRYERWPRTIFYAQNINIPGINTFTTEISRNGFTISIPMFVKYDSREIQITFLADKEGYHYQDWRNMVLESGHPLVAGDPKASFVKKDGQDDVLDIRLRNDPDGGTAPYHRWTVHNFRPTAIGEVELSHSDASFLTFQVTGTFTHIDYDCGRDELVDGKGNAAALPQSDASNPEGGGENPDGGNEEDTRETEPPPDMNQVNEDGGGQGESSSDYYSEEDDSQQSPDPGDLWPEDAGESSNGAGDSNSGYDYNDDQASTETKDRWANEPEQQEKNGESGDSDDEVHVFRSIFDF